MALLALVKGVGGTLETYFLNGTPSSCTVNLYNAQGALKVSAGTVSLDSVSTSVTTVAAKATTLSLASATGVVNGRRYRLGATASTDPTEVVTVKSLSGSTATLTAPTIAAHATGAVFTGLRAYMDVTSTQADTLWWGGHADFIPASGDPVTEDVDCVAHKIPEMLCDESDLREIFPKLGKIVDAELDLPRTLRTARDRFLLDFGGKFRVYAALGASAFREPCAMKWWLQRRYALGDDFADIMAQLAKDYQAQIEHLRSQVAFDTDGDERTDGVDDVGFTSITLDRA
jgi:hypothetical protein